MKLIYKIAIRLSLAMIPLLALWTAIFYFKMVDEINDETDDSLESYSERIIMKKLAGEEMPQLDDGSNNSYFIMPVSLEYAQSHPHIAYFNESVYIREKREMEPARVLITIFKDREGVWYELKVSTPTFERADLLETMFIWILILYAVILTTGIVVTMLIFKKSMAPLYTLLYWLDKYLPGKNISVQFPETDITEFKKLNKAAVDAAKRLEDVYLEQKQFIGNASHELQTPLAILGNRMEWMLDNMDLSQEQMEEVVRMLQTQRQAVKLNKDLLLLAKIDNMQFPHSDRVDIVPLISHAVEMYGEIFEEKQMECTIELPEKYVLTMNSSLASVLITNLIRNAYIHSGRGASIKIKLEDGVLVVMNTGCEALDSKLIFERFYKGTQKEGSTGLGLSLVKAVCNNYALDVQYVFKGGYHHFSVKF